MSYGLQISSLFQLHVDKRFRAAFLADAESAAPGLSAEERQELQKLPLAEPHSGPPQGHPSLEFSPAPADAPEEGHVHGACRACQASKPTDAFLRNGVLSRCRRAMPRTYRLLEELARGAGEGFEADLLRGFWAWKQPFPDAYQRDRIAANPSIGWEETARVLQIANRVYWQFYGYAVSTAPRYAAEAPYVADVARFELDLLFRRVSLYQRFQPPGPVPASTSPERRLRLSRYAELARYRCAVHGARPAPRPCGVVFLYNGERLRSLQVGEDAASLLERLDGSAPVGAFAGQAAKVLEAMAAVGALEEA